jgi:menaquinone-9 beta-reductase
VDDVVIVGAGPAGSTLAAMLAGEGVRVRLLDAARFPRRKPCGESLNPGAVAALGRLGWELSGRPLRGWRVSAFGCEFTGLYPDGHRGLCCERLRLDEMLLRQAAAAGAAVAQGARVGGLLVEDGRVAGVYGLTPRGRRFRLPARIVVGADGIRSVVARALGLLGEGRLRKLALTAHFDAVGEQSDLGEVHIGPGLVAGLAPLGAGRANLTCLIPYEAARLVAGDKEAFLLRALHAFPALAPRLAGASPGGEVLACGPFDMPVRRAAVPGALLVGDAAGYFDPLTGQGIYRALHSAELAAPALLAALQGGDWTPLYQYDRRRRREFRLGTRLQHLIEFALRHPRLLRGAMRALRWRPLSARLMRCIGDCPGGAGWRRST